MKQKIISLLLVFAMVLSLSACKSNKNSDNDSSVPNVTTEYASNSPLDVFDTIEAVSKMKNFTFDLKVNEIDTESFEATNVITDISGKFYADTKQAELTAVMSDGSTFTNAVIDGNKCYIDVVSAAKYLSSAFADTDEEDSDYFVEECGDLAKNFPSDYVSVELKEDIWTTLESEDFTAIKNLLQEISDTVKKNVSDKVKTDKSSSTLSLGLDVLQEQLKARDKALIDNADVYKNFMSDYLTNNLSEFVDASGWTISDVADTFFADYEEEYENIQSLENEGEIIDGSVKVITCGSDAEGYTIDFMSSYNAAVEYCLNIYPADAETISVPENSTNYLDCIDDCFTLYMDTFIYKNYRYPIESEYDDETDSGDESYYWDETGEEDVVSDSIDTQKVSGRSDLEQTQLSTDDNKTVDVVIPDQYEEVEAENNEYGVNDLILTGKGYLLEFASIYKDNRTLSQMTEENAANYIDITKEDWGFEITKNASDVITSDNGQINFVSYEYYDSDEKQNVTVLTGNIAVDKSDFTIGFDLFIYNNSLTSKEANALNSMLKNMDVDFSV